MGEVFYLPQAKLSRNRVLQAADDVRLTAFHELKVKKQTALVSPDEIDRLSHIDPHDLLAEVSETHGLINSQEARAAAQICLLTVCTPKDVVEWKYYGKA